MNVGQPVNVSAMHRHQVREKASHPAYREHSMPEAGTAH
jgi:hypothetical protein